MKTLLPKALFLCCLLAFSTMAKAQLSGNYTVDSTASGSTNFTSVTDAVKALYKSGVNGPVTFSISNGQYQGQLKFNGAITGASSTNTVSFKGKSGVKEDVVITTRRDTIIVQMARVGYVTFEDLSIEAIDTVPTRAVFLTKNCAYNRFTNCNISLLSTSNRSQPVVVSCRSSDYNRWEKCNINNGYMGFTMLGTSASSLSTGNTIKECTIRDFTSYGILLYHQNHTTIASNDVRSTSSFWRLAGIVNIRSVGTTINANTVITPYSALLIEESNLVVRGDSINVTNNVLITTANYGTCVLHEESQKVNYLHNYIESTNGEALSMYTDNLNDIQVANNIFKSDGNGWTCMSVYVNDTTSTPLYWDHNNYEFSNYSYFMYSTRGVASFADYQGLYSSKWNKNSLTIASDWDYNLNRGFSTGLNNVGVDMGVDTDIDGNARPNSNDKKIDIGPNDYWLAPIDLDIYAISGPLTVDLTTNTVSVVFRNAGTNDINTTDAYVEYSIDSGKTWVEDTLEIKSLKASQTLKFSFTQPWVPTRSGDFQLSVRIAPPIANDPDTKDQLDIQLCSGYQGTYTVGPNGHFKDLEEAIGILKCGVSGPLVFDIESGAYNYNFKLGSINGASASNTITIRGAHADSVTIYSSTSTPTLYMNGTDFFHFENITLENKNNAGIVVHMLNRANRNQFSGCKIMITANFPSWNSYALVMAEDPGNTWSQGSAGSYNIFEDNLIYGGSSNVVLSGNGSRFTRFNQFYNNRLVKAEGSSFNMNYQDSLYFIGNTVDSMAYLWNNALIIQDASNFIVEQNHIIGGVYLYNGNGSGWNRKSPSSISNNEIVGDNNPQTIYMSNSSNIKIQHNSTSYLGIYSGMAFYYCSDIDFRNNILSQKSGTAALVLESTSFSAFDFNNYTHNAQNLAEINRTAYADLAALKNYNTAYNQNSQDKDPDWINTTRTLKPGSRFPDLYAPGVGIVEDIEGKSRCQYYTALGAYEVSKTQLPVKADFTAPDTLWLGSPTSLQNTLSPSIEYGSTWLVNGKMVSDSLHLVYEPTNTGLDTITLVMDNCNGPDSVTKYVFVSNVIRPPSINFSASAVDLYTDEPFKLFDLSKNGPVEWSWDISPKLAYDVFLGITTNTFSIDSTEQSPSGTFFIAGDYTVKLKAGNALGSDSLTKTLFIRVREQATMCGARSESNGAFGTLFDDGGIKGNYSKGLNGNEKCVYRISGCHGELAFDFKTFDLAPGDYLRIYDGQDDYGKPLWDENMYPKGMTGGLTDASVPSSMLAASGGAYIVFESSDFSVTKDGFAIDWTATSGGITAPTAGILAPDTVCVGLPFIAENNSTGGWDFAQWDIDADGSYENIGNKMVYTANTAQNLLLKLRANGGCAGADSLTKTIVVENAKTLATPSFTSSDTLIVAGKTVTLAGSANYCVGEFRWEISPANYSLAADATLSQATLPLVFTKSGKYTVKLITENPFGKDSLVKTNYIRVIEYCQPAVTNLNRDLGISRVQFNEIDHGSTVGDEGYSDYTHLSAHVEPGKRYPITVSRTSARQAMNRNIWIDWNLDGDFDDVNELIATENGSRNMVFLDSVRVPRNARMGNTVMRVATNLASLNNTACGPHMFGEFEDYTIRIGEDVTPPVITLAGKLVDTIEVFSSWTEPGYRAFDLVRGNITKNVVVTNNLDNAVTGTYTVEYEVADRLGNRINKRRTVVVADRTLPTLTKGGVDTLFIQINELVTDPILTYNDNYDKALILERNGTVDNSQLGYYPVQYCVTDSDGNGPVCVNIIVQVGDSIAPKVTLQGGSPELVDVYSNYNDAGITVVENHEYTTTTSGTWTGSTDVLGTFDLTYTVTDRAGNQVAITRQIQVVDRMAPELASASTIYLARWTAFDAATAAAFNDNYYVSADLTVVVTNNTVDVNSLGDYSVTYEVSDPSGNKETITVPVVVVETRETVGIDEADAASVTLYPNPTNGRLHMEFQLPDNNLFQISVRNTLGQEVHTIVQNRGGTFNETIYLQNLPASIYYVVVQGEGFELVEKFVLTD